MSKPACMQCLYMSMHACFKFYSKLNLISKCKLNTACILYRIHALILMILVCMAQNFLMLLSAWNCLQILLIILHILGLDPCHSATWMASCLVFLKMAWDMHATNTMEVWICTGCLIWQYRVDLNLISLCASIYLFAYRFTPFVSKWHVLHELCSATRCKNMHIICITHKEIHPPVICVYSYQCAGTIWRIKN